MCLPARVISRATELAVAAVKDTVTTAVTAVPELGTSPGPAWNGRACPCGRRMLWNPAHTGCLAGVTRREARLPSRQQTSATPLLLQDFYKLTLEALQEANNERLWFKTQLKLCGLWFRLEEFSRMQRILRELHRSDSVWSSGACRALAGGDAGLGRAWRCRARRAWQPCAPGMQRICGVAWRADAVVAGLQT